jgi:chromosome segregation protein
MYLSQLTLHGFKSFAEPTTLEFAPGITAIVGPNGCGKSNIVDAVRWAVGEQRPTALRSETMDDVIFNGTAERKPLGMAEVELTVENNRGVLPTEYSEVALGRRLFQDGTSEYLLNRAECRLKDIRDLFMDTGMGADAYSVIELKMIDDLLSESTEERRRLFEEAAGITRYKRRRRQALRKLDNTQQDLNRVRDLTGEVEKKVRRLKKQAERAEEHRTISGRLHRKERALAEAEYTRLADRRDALASEVQALSEQADALEADQSDAEDRLEALRETLAEREDELSDEREALEAARDRVRRQEGEQRLAQERLAQARRDAKRLRREAERDADRREDLREKRERLKEEIAEAAPAREQAEATLETAKEKRQSAREDAEAKQKALRTLRRKEEELEAQRAEERSRRDRRASRLDTLEDEQRRAYDRLEKLDARADALDGRVADAEAAQQKAESDAEDARKAFHRTEADHAEREAALDEATETLETLRRRREAARAEVRLLESLVADYSGHTDAVQLFAEEGLTEKQSPEDFRTVADVLSTGSAHRAALAAALGDWAACPVAATRAEARQALARLRRRGEGRATVIALDRLPAGNGHAAPAPGEAKPLRPAVRVLEDSYAPLADALLDNVFLVDSLDDAERLAERGGPHARFVTPGGEWAGGPGLLHGGAREAGGAAGSGRIGRREQLAEHRRALEQLSEQIDAQEAAVREAQDALEAVSLDERRAALRRAEQRQSEAAEEARRLAHEQETLEEQRRETADRLDALETELAEGREALEALQDEADAIDDQRQALRAEREAGAEAAEEAEAAARAAQERFGEARVAAVEARSRHESLQQEREQAAERLDELKARQTEREAEQATLQDTIEEAEEKQDALQGDIEDARADRVRRADALEEAREDFEDVKADASEAEETLRDLRRQREEVMHQESEKSVRLAEIKTRLEELVESTAENFDGLHLPEEAELPAEDFDEDAAREEVQALRGKLRRLGDVNPLALKEYDEEEERLDFLREQQADLEEAEDTLLDTVTEINEEAAGRFADTFSEIQRSFSEIFERLFGSGAAARLQLDEDEDPLESDIEIIAQPPGKRPSILPQLSGGEKALTAIALLFAIYLVKPSPFCILDEVDAPLDDANTDRFMRLLRDFTDETQFILVTHNKRTMRQADRLYGVTMQEQGVSTLVGVELEEAAQLAEAA